MKIVISYFPDGEAFIADAIAQAIRSLVPGIRRFEPKEDKPVRHIVLKTKGGSG